MSDMTACRYPGIGKYILSLFLQAGAYALLLTLIELNIITYVTKTLSEALDIEGFLAPPSRGNEVGVTRAGDDDDVAAERARVEGNVDTGDDIVVIKDLTKVYKMPWCSGEVEAVCGLSLGVGRGECFGLLGVNGAGKTSTFKMLTGDDTISGGTALINGFDAASNMNAARK